ncbi:MAG: hypothetical protein ABH896_02430 [Candidatus Jacksonbacteria bacterium]
MQNINNIRERAPEVKEGEKQPQIELWITRHANRAPSGELVPEGVAAARAKGEAVDVEVFKGYSSLEQSDRAYKTLQAMSEASGIKSPQTEGLYETRRRHGLYYDIAGPLEPRVKAQTKIINETVKKDYPDFDPKSSDPKWGEIRERYQPIGLRNILATDDELVHIFAMGAAYQFNQMAEVASRYTAKRERLAQADKAEALDKNVILNEGTHGIFIESIFKKALIRKQLDGSEKKGFEAWVDNQGQPQLEQSLGGIIEPTESIKTQYTAGKSVPERLPVYFEKERFKGEQCFLDMEKIRLLARQFKIYLWILQDWQEDKIGEEEFTVKVDELREEFNAE